MEKSAFCCVGLVNPKSPENVGSVMRAAGCYGVDEVYYTGNRFELARRFATDTKQMVETMSTLIAPSISSDRRMAPSIPRSTGR